VLVYFVCFCGLDWLLRLLGLCCFACLCCLGCVVFCLFCRVVDCLFVVCCFKLSYLRDLLYEFAYLLTWLALFVV